jgi:DNA-directed RNA polymerase II subunit RPB3
VGNLEPDAVIQQGIKVLQQKLAAVIQDLTEGDGAGSGMNGMGTGDGFGAPRTPDAGINGAAWQQDQGFTTPYQASGWGAGGATPFGATPYGQPSAEANGWT